MTQYEIGPPTISSIEKSRDQVLSVGLLIVQHQDVKEDLLSFLSSFLLSILGIMALYARLSIFLRYIEKSTLKLFIEPKNRMEIETHVL